MSEIFVLSGIVISLVFFVSGLSKWNDNRNNVKMLHDFGFNEQLSRLIAPVLPVTEISIALLLLVPKFAWVGAVLATALLLSFTILLSITLIQGKHPNCNCFGQTKSRPISWGTASRNLLLTLLAGSMLLLNYNSLNNGVFIEAVSLIRNFEIISIVLSALIAVALFQFYLLFNLVRQQGRILLEIDNFERRLDGAGIPRMDQFFSSKMLPVGEAAPEFSGTLIDGKAVALKELLSEGKALTLLFINADCAPCKDLLSELILFRPLNHRNDKLVIITSGSRETNIEKLGFLDNTEILLQDNLELNDLFGIVGTPSAVCISRSGIISSPVAVGRDAIMDLLKEENLVQPSQIPTHSFT